MTTAALSPAARAQTRNAEAEALLSSIFTADSLPKYLRLLIYGPAGVGKTVLAAGAPKCLIVDIDKGTDVLTNGNHPELEKVPCMRYVGLKQMELLAKHIGAGTFPLEIENLVFDTFSELAYRDLDFVVKNEENAQKARVLDLPTRIDYNINTHRMRRIIQMFKDLPIGLIFTAHERILKDDRSGNVVRIGPELSDKVEKTLMAAVRVAGHYTTRNVGGQRVRTLQIQPNAIIQAKTRLAGLPDIIANPTIDVLLKADRKEQQEVKGEVDKLESTPLVGLTTEG